MYGKIPKVYEIVCGNETVNKTARSFSPYKICMATSGSGVWKINGSQVLVSKGDVFFLNNTDLRCFMHISEPIHMIICEFDPLSIDKMFVYLFKDRPTDLPRSFSVKNLSEFERNLKNALKEAKEKKPYSEICVINSVNLALTEALRRFLNGTETKEKEMRKEVIKTLDYVDKHLCEDISLEKIAKEQNMSASALCKQFSKSVGIGFSRYVSQKRVEGVIKTICKNREINILDAAFSYGFKNSAAFYEAFKRITGSTPKNIRKNPYYSL